MCEINAFIVANGKEELLLESVNFAKEEDGKVLLRNLFGEQKVFKGGIKEVSLVKNRIVLGK